jgi:hypothetical protein
MTQIICSVGMCGKLAYISRNSNEPAVFCAAHGFIEMYANRHDPQIEFTSFRGPSKCICCKTTAAYGLSRPGARPKQMVCKPCADILEVVTGRAFARALAPRDHSDDGDDCPDCLPAKKRGTYIVTNLDRERVAYVCTVHLPSYNKEGFIVKNCTQKCRGIVCGTPSCTDEAVWKLAERTESGDLGDDTPEFVCDACKPSDDDGSYAWVGGCSREARYAEYSTEKTTAKACGVHKEDDWMNVVGSRCHACVHTLGWGAATQVGKKGGLCRTCAGDTNSGWSPLFRQNIVTCAIECVGAPEGFSFLREVRYGKRVEGDRDARVDFVAKLDEEGVHSVTHTIFVEIDEGSHWDRGDCDEWRRLTQLMDTGPTIIRIDPASCFKSKVSSAICDELCQQFGGKGFDIAKAWVTDPQSVPELGEYIDHDLVMRIAHHVIQQIRTHQRIVYVNYRCDKHIVYTRSRLEQLAAGYDVETVSIE